MINLIFIDKVKCLDKRNKYFAEANCKAHLGKPSIVYSIMLSQVVNQEQTSTL